MNYNKIVMGVTNQGMSNKTKILALSTVEKHEGKLTIIDPPKDYQELIKSPRKK